MNRFLSIVVSLVLSLTCFGQEVQDAFDRYQESVEIEKVYVSLDKPYYIQENVIYGKVYVVDGRTHQLIDEEPIVHLDWIDPDGTILKVYELKIKNGVGAFDIETFIDNKTGSYTLRAYTQYQLNFDKRYLFQKEVRLINRPDYMPKEQDSIADYTMHFFPEGGDLVAGLQNSVAFKLESANGQVIKTEGRVIDDEGSEITNFKTWKEGMGKFEIIPNQEKEYWAEVEVNGITKRFKLPSSLKAGYVLKAHTITNDQIHIDIKSNTKDGLEGVKLLVHVRGQMISFYNLKKEHQEIVVLEKSKIPSGIVHLTLFDSKDRPVAERLVFNKNENEKVKVVFDIEESVGKESLVSGTVIIESEDTVKTVSSLAIYNVDILPEGIRGLDIENYLFLQSDLKGQVYDLSQYFIKDDNRTRAALDLLLMTHGWRRFNWRSVLAHEYFQLEIPKEYSKVIAGRVLKKDTDKPIKADVGLNILDDDKFAILQQTTEDDGFFFFPGMDLPDTTDILIQAVKHNARRSKKIKEGELRLIGDNNVDIELLDLSEVAYDSTLTHHDVTFEIEELIKQQKNLSFQNSAKVLDESLWNIDIEEVVIQARRYSAAAKSKAVQKRYKEKGIFFFASTEKFLADDPQYDGMNYVDIYDMLRVLIPGSKRTVIGGFPRVTLGGLTRGSVARIAVNGQLIPVEQEPLLRPEDIYSADVLGGFRAAALYGPSTVISLLTRENGEYNEPALGIVNINHPGYYQAREFYNPVYGDKDKLDNPDYRTTIFWEDDLNLNSSKSSEFQFRTSNLTGRHLIFIEGLTEGGVPFTAKRYFNVTN